MHAATRVTAATRTILLAEAPGEWSVVCPKTGNPFGDFSPVDHGQTLNRVALTVHNYSTTPVRLVEPVVSLGGKESQSEHAVLDAERARLTNLTLQPCDSAEAIVTGSRRWVPRATCGRRLPRLRPRRDPPITEPGHDHPNLDLGLAAAATSCGR